MKLCIIYEVWILVYKKGGVRNYDVIWYKRFLVCKYWMYCFDGFVDWKEKLKELICFELLCWEIDMNFNIIDYLIINLN